MSTALEIIKGSLKKIGVIAQGETPSSEESTDALRALNSMLDSWSNLNLLMFGTNIDEKVLTPGQNSYTLGPGGDFNIEVPVRTDSAFIKLANDSTERKLKIIDNSDWGAIRTKAISSIPDSLYIDRNFPLHKLYLYPNPDQAHTLLLHNIRQISTISSLTTELTFPKGYERAIEFNLCKELAPEYGKQLSNDIYMIANESLANVKRANIKIKERGVDPFLVQGSSYDWRVGR